jgi:hypothetical protein
LPIVFILLSALFLPPSLPPSPPPSLPPSLPPFLKDSYSSSGVIIDPYVERKAQEKAAKERSFLSVEGEGSGKEDGGRGGSHVIESTCINI